MCLSLLSLNLYCRPTDYNLSIYTDIKQRLGLILIPAAIRTKSMPYQDNARWFPNLPDIRNPPFPTRFSCLQDEGVAVI